MAGVDKEMKMPEFSPLPPKKFMDFTIKEMILGGAILVLFIMFATFAGLYGKTNTDLAAAQPYIAKGKKASNTCYSKMCLESTGYVLANANITVDPCTDFYTYACGNYKMWHPLDPSVSQHTIFSDMYKENQDRLRNILESPVRRNLPWATEKKLKEAFMSCLDDFTIEKLKGKPFITQILPKMNGAYLLNTWQQNKWDINTAIKVTQVDFWTDAIFAMRVDVDFWNPKKAAIEIYPGGTSRHLWSYHYISTSSRSQKIQTDYQNFMKTVAGLLVRDSGINLPDNTSRISTFVSDAFTIEQKVAQLRYQSAYNFNAHADENRITLGSLGSKTGTLIKWLTQGQAMFPTAGVTANTYTIVHQLAYLKSMNDYLSGLPTATQARMVHNYLVWRLLENYLQNLSWEYVHANRIIYEDITGRSEFLGKWRYCFNYLSRSMPEALGALFVANHFADKNINKVTDITGTMKQALKNMLKTTPWMDQATRNMAESKIEQASYKLGYPAFILNHDKMDTLYGHVSINVSDWFGNVLRINHLQQEDWSKHLKNGEDRNEWYFRVYDTNMAILWYWNEVVVPAGFLQFPLYTYNLPHYYAFGSLGSILGEFIVHIVDANGRNWDVSGKYLSGQSWWSNATIGAYNSTKNCMINAYNQTQGPFINPFYKNVTYFPINSVRSVTENIAIVSGLRLAHNAYHLWESQNGMDLLAPSGQDLTNDQMFFMAFAQSYCFNRNNASSYWNARFGRIQENYVVNLAVSQMPEFSKAFNCPANAKLNPANKCTLY